MSSTAGNAGIWIIPTNVFAYEATIGTVPIVLVYLLANIALPLYFWRIGYGEMDL